MTASVLEYVPGYDPIDIVVKESNWEKRRRRAVQWPEPLSEEGRLVERATATVRYCVTSCDEIVSTAAWITGEYDTAEASYVVAVDQPAPSNWVELARYVFAGSRTLTREEQSSHRALISETARPVQSPARRGRTF